MKIVEFLSRIMPMLLRLGEQLFADTGGDWEKAESLLHETIKYHRGSVSKHDAEMQAALDRFGK